MKSLFVPIFDSSRQSLAWSARKNGETSVEKEVGRKSKSYYKRTFRYAIQELSQKVNFMKHSY
jgi:hypothetical protein